MTRQRHRGNTESEQLGEQWGGARLRMMLQCIYTIAFLCLLRFDEVLRIEFKDIEVVDKCKGHIKLTLPFRKTHQYGGICKFQEFGINEYRDQTISPVLQPQRAPFRSHS
jgi:integrase